jgi:hypothetical protein
MRFEEEFFKKMSFEKSQLEKYLMAVRRDTAIAAKSDIPEVKFTFSYSALIKLGIILIAREGYKVRSVPGHHSKIIEKLGEILKNEDVVVVGNRMRNIRNFEFYEGGIAVSRKEAKEYFDFVKNLLDKFN